MGRDVCADSPAARAVFEEADQALGFALSKLCFEGPEEELRQTRNQQPAILATSIALLQALRERTALRPAFVAGHSLGELVALYSAGVFGLETGLQLMKTRSELMANAGGGAMTAVIGFDRAQLDDLVAATDGVSIANDNSDAQVVISGSPEAVESVSGALKCKRAIPLAVSGALPLPVHGGGG